MSGVAIRAMLVGDEEFAERLAAYLEPCGHLGNVRLAWIMARRHGFDAGLLATEDAIRARAEAVGGTWDRVRTRRWFVKVAGLAGDGPAEFAAFYDEYRDVLGC